MRVESFDIRASRNPSQQTTQHNPAAHSAITPARDALFFAPGGTLRNSVGRSPARPLWEMSSCASAGKRAALIDRTSSMPSAFFDATKVTSFKGGGERGKGCAARKQLERQHSHDHKIGAMVATRFLLSEHARARTHTHKHTPKHKRKHAPTLFHLAAASRNLRSTKSLFDLRRVKESKRNRLAHPQR